MALPTLRMISTLTLLALVACRKEPPPDTGDSTPEGPEDTGPDEDLDNTYELCEDTTWSGEVVVGSVYYVCPTATLTIEPGAVVAFKPGSGLVIDGVLRADGTTHAPILFRTNYSISGSNYGVAVGSSGDSSSLSFASFVSIDLRLEGGAMAGVADVAFSDATLGVYSRTDPFTVARLSFADNEREDQTALIARDLPQLNVSESTFFKVAVGILFDGVQDEAALTLDDITFQDNRSAVVVGSIGDYVHTVSATELDISDSTSDALVFSNANVTLTDVSITDTKGSGVTGDINTALTLYDVTVSGTTDVGINVVGSIEAELLTVEGSESSGIYAGKMGSTFTTVAVSDVQGYGLYSTGDLTVDAAVVSNTTSTAIYASRGDLTVTNSLVSEILGSGIYATYGDVVVRDTWLEHLEAHGIYASTASITLSDVSIEDVRSNGVYAYRSDLVIEPGTLGTRLEAIDGTGLYATDGDIVVENVSLVDVRGTGIYARYGSVTVIDSGLQDIVGTGIYGYFGDVTVSGAVLNGVYGTGIYSYRGDLVVRPGTIGVSINDVDTYGLYTYTGTMDAEGFEVQGSRSTAVYVNYGDMTVRDAVIVDSGGAGLYVKDGDAMVSGVYIEETDDAGIQVTTGDLTLEDSTLGNTGGDAVYVSEGDALISGLEVRDLSAAQDQPSAGGSGVDVRGYTLLSDCWVDGTEGHAVYAESLDMSACTVSNGAERGVYVYGTDPSTVSLVEISGNGTYGLGGPTADNNLVVSESNITGNGSYGLYYVGQATGCYVADNAGLSGVDTTSGGTLDGSFDVKGTQVYYIDQLQSPASGEVSGAGY